MQKYPKLRFKPGPVLLQGKNIGGTKSTSSVNLAKQHQMVYGYQRDFGALNILGQPYLYTHVCIIQQRLQNEKHTIMFWQTNLICGFLLFKRFRKTILKSKNKKEIDKNKYILQI